MNPLSKKFPTWTEQVVDDSTWNKITWAVRFDEHLKHLCTLLFSQVKIPFRIHFKWNHLNSFLCTEGPSTYTCISNFLFFLQFSVMVTLFFLPFFSFADLKVVNAECGERALTPISPTLCDRLPQITRLIRRQFPSKRVKCQLVFSPAAFHGFRGLLLFLPLW